MATAVEMIQHFDAVCFILKNHREMTSYQLGIHTHIPASKIDKLCRELCISPYRKRVKDGFIGKGYVKEMPVHGDARKPMTRPPASYTNIPTPFGIATEMLNRQLEEEKENKKR